MKLLQVRPNDMSLALLFLAVVTTALAVSVTPVYYNDVVVGEVSGSPRPQTGKVFCQAMERKTSAQYKTPCIAQLNRQTHKWVIATHVTHISVSADGASVCGQQKESVGGLYAACYYAASGDANNVAQQSSTSTGQSTAVALPTVQPTCECPCMGGLLCSTLNLCYRTQCNNGGSCDQQTGTCVCPDGFIGPSCSTPTCNYHGFYDPLTEACVCDRGWTGESCSVCGQPPDALPFSSMYVCIPASSSSTARNTPYILTAVPNKVAMEMVNGMLRVDSSSPYHAIVPSAQGTVGYDGRRYACDCQPIQPPQTARTRFKHKYKQKQRITTADLDAFNSTIVQCIAASQATSQQITELTNVWLTCVAQAQNGRLGDSWFIAGIFFIITTGVLAIVLAMTCIKLSYETSLQKEEAEMQTKEVQPLVKPPPPIQQSIQPVSNKKLHW